MAVHATDPSRFESPAEVWLGSEFAREFPELGVPVQAVRPAQPAVLVLNESLAREFELSSEWLRSDAGVRLLVGNDLPSEAAPVAQVYAGHQFGSYSPRLGDGRAMLIGELTDRTGAKRDLHLKGSGPTPFTRADGFAAVGPMLREYLVGEAMHALGVPTTRALAVTATGRTLMRSESLDPVPGAVLARTASSHLRVGTFQFVRSTANTALLNRLVHHAIDRHYPLLRESDTPSLDLLIAVIESQARLVAAWMLVGFVHGVMNTDNMTISGETIDYGPCAFIDAYDAAAVFSSIDHAGRYAFGSQPAIAHWNLTRFAESLLPLIDDDAERAKNLAITALSGFGPAYDTAWLTGMRAKLGLGGATESKISDAELTTLTAEMLGTLHTHRIDYTQFFRALSDAARGNDETLSKLFGETQFEELQSQTAEHTTSNWFSSWRALAPDAEAMDRVNPIYIPRNELLDEALDAASAGDLEPFTRMLEVVTHPFARREGGERFEAPATAGVRRHITYCGT